MSRRVESDDVLMLAVPEGLDPTDLTQRQRLLTNLEAQVHEWIWAQWADLPADKTPWGIELADVDWLITNKVFEVDEFQPAHDCEECRSGNEKGKAFLRANPGRWLAMANLRYTEVWA